MAYSLELPASNAFAGLEGIDALVAVGAEPARCVRLTCDVAAMVPGANPFLESQEARAVAPGAASVAHALVAFALCMSSMAPVGGVQVGRSLV